MSNIKKLLKNFSFVTIGTFGSQLLLLLATIRIAKIYGPELFGEFSFLLVQRLLLANIAGLGLRYVLIRTISTINRGEESHKVFPALLINILSSFPVLIIYLVYNRYLGSLSLYAVLLLIISSLVLNLWETIESIYYGRQAMLIPSLIKLFNGSIWCLMVYTIPISKISTSNLFLIFILINFGALVILIIDTFRKRFLRFISVNMISSGFNLLRQSIFFYINILVSLPTNYLSNNFIEINSTKKELGYYNANSRIVQPLLMVNSLLFTILLPDLSNLWDNDKLRFRRILKNNFHKFIKITAFLTFLGIVFRQEIISLLFGEQYIPVIEIVKYQFWFVFLFSINNFNGTILGGY